MTVVHGIPKQSQYDVSSVLSYVRQIVDDVRRRGDTALIEYTKKFDGVDIDSVELGSDAKIKCLEGLDNEVKNAIDTVYELLTKFYEEFKPRDFQVELGGVKLGIMWKPIGSVGIYVPGGRKPYPSTLLMAGVPAQVAKVHRIYVASPPNKIGCVDPAIIYVSQLINAQSIYRVGGAQIIAAMAYGTETVKKVDKIVGPGNIYVQAAKIIVRDVVEIDGVEGPTELVIIADESADPNQVALDMMAQSEHGLESPIVLITTSQKLALAVENLIKDSKGTFYIHVVESLEEALAIANELAPEHLSLHINEAYKVLSSIDNAGAISAGTSPPALIDYIGPNHILPTNRWSRVRGALTVYDFLKPIAILFDDKNIDKKILRAAETLARYEGFDFHAKSIVMRHV